MVYSKTFAIEKNRKFLGGSEHLVSDKETGVGISRHWLVVDLYQGRCMTITLDNLLKYRFCGELHDYKPRKFIRPFFIISGKQL